MDRQEAYRPQPYVAPYPESKQPPNAQVPYPDGQQPSYPPGPYPGQQPMQPGFVAGYPGPVPNQNNSNIPSAPLEKLPGYENCTFDPATLPPPTYDESIASAPPQNLDFSNVPVLTEEEVRESLLEHVSDHCCYGNEAAQKMQLRDVRMSSAIHYSLETFGEKREVSWKSVPYEGQPLDTPMNGPAPSPWEVPIAPSQLFVSSKGTCEVPHTASLRPCNECFGMGRKQCTSCQGRGRNPCSFCNGTGRRTLGDGESCTSCSGTGSRQCLSCSGKGLRRCSKCDGKGQLKFFLEMKITWCNHLGDYVTDQLPLPKDLILGVTGQIAFEDSKPRLWPLTNFPEAPVNESSARLIDEHARAFPLERILQQRQKVQIIPIAQVQYTWKNESGTFVVYGHERRVHFPDYPQQCCCGCTLL